MLTSPSRRESARPSYRRNRASLVFQLIFSELTQPTDLDGKISDIFLSLSVVKNARDQLESHLIIRVGRSFLVSIRVGRSFLV